MSVLLKVILVAVLAVIGPQIYKVFIKPALYEKRIFHHAPGPCEYVKGIENGAEDMEVLPSGLVIMSTGLRILVDDTTPPYSNVRGSIKTFDFKHPEKGAKDLTIESQLDMETFNPHGISVWQDPKSSSVFLFVINHHRSTAIEESVEKFEFDEKKLLLKHMTSFKDPAFTLLNDIKATGPDSFYYTNFFWNSKLLLTILEMLSGVRLGNVGYYDGNSARKLAAGLAAANGVNLSPDGRFLYVGNAMADSVMVYNRLADNSLTLHREYVTDCGVDNIDVKGEYLWIGCHADFSKIGAHAQDPSDQSNPSPSKVLRLKMKDGDVAEAVEMFSDDGRVISASSVAVYYKEMMLIGSIDYKAVLCQIKYIG